MTTIAVSEKARRKADLLTVNLVNAALFRDLHRAYFDEFGGGWPRNTEVERRGAARLIVAGAIAGLSALTRCLDRSDLESASIYAFRMHYLPQALEADDQDATLAARRAIELIDALAADPSRSATAEDLRALRKALAASPPPEDPASLPRDALAQTWALIDVIEPIVVEIRACVHGERTTLGEIAGASPWEAKGLWKSLKAGLPERDLPV